MVLESGEYEEGGRTMGCLAECIQDACRQCIDTREDVCPPEASNAIVHTRIVEPVTTRLLLESVPIFSPKPALWAINMPWWIAIRRIVKRRKANKESVSGYALLRLYATRRRTDGT
jgi:hypothetical protein